MHKKRVALHVATLAMPMAAASPTPSGGFHSLLPLNTFHIVYGFVKGLYVSKRGGIIANFMLELLCCKFFVMFKLHGFPLNIFAFHICMNKNLSQDKARLRAYPSTVYCE